MSVAGYAGVGALSNAGLVNCWGEGYGFDEMYSVPLPSTPLKTISLSATGYGCGLKSDGTVACWQPAVGGTPPAGAPTDVFQL